MSVALLLSLLLAVGRAYPAESEGDIVIFRRGAQPSTWGEERRYTGQVRIDQPFQTEAPARLVGQTLTFEPGARTAWHDSPGGQSILVTFGQALVQEENGPLETAYAGDAVTFPPGVRHWFGAAPDAGMTALAVSVAVEGKNANWGPKVTDGQYQAGSPDKKSKGLAINRAGSMASAKAAQAHFTGLARVDSLFAAKGGSDAYGAFVTFEPCARTDWHSHPMGQTLIVSSGRGYVQRAGGPVHEIRQGDIAWTPAGVVHWHGAAPDTAMTHLALSERVEGQVPSWGAKVTDEEYGFSNPNEMPVRYQKIALISAFAAGGDIERLKEALAEGLESGLTVNEIKEVLIHVYAYAGFPRALNGINAFMAVMDKREKEGARDREGPEAKLADTDKSKYEYGHDVLARLRNPAFQPGPPGSLKIPDQRPRYEIFVPTIEVFLKEHLFADIFRRDLLDYRAREIATVGALANLPGANDQFRSHVGLAMTQGFSEEQMRHLFIVMGTYLGRERGDNALGVLGLATEAKSK
jgi:quercetin dioxygenase-like cupin family protein